MNAEYRKKNRLEFLTEVRTALDTHINIYIHILKIKMNAEYRKKNRLDFLTEVRTTHTY